MKILRKTIDQSGIGEITLKPDEKEVGYFAAFVTFKDAKKKQKKKKKDMWHAYNLVSVGDHVTAGTFRKLQKVTATGTTSNSRVKLTLTVEVVKVDFEPKAGKLRLSGKVVSENPHIKKGAFHTLELEVRSLEDLFFFFVFFSLLFF
jgi:protein pelota